MFDCATSAVDYLRANYVRDLPGLRIVPASLLTQPVPTKPPHVWPPPGHVALVEGAPPLRVGPVLRLRMRPQPHMLVKAARRGISKKFGCYC